MLPSVSLLASVNEHTRRLHDTVNDATGGELLVATVILLVVRFVAPLSSVTDSVTGYVPAAAKTCEALVADEFGLPSPKLQERDVIVPSLSVLWSVNWHVRPLQLASNAAIGGAFAPTLMV